ncbi:response regulator [Actinacidiphila rubida]|uniref:Two-component system, OmpR family, KDP operon response regulator KdpE n=1 Tax=Actinacidiphila rubida TaxID=310780 RepID=A0A1H8UML7_9ACTN|nr:response regulator transcription factor [Actinacidiphila rubida]SEP04326.1 two-component system, OmpR family, KDP operon response regulator KdpE [Actinacidiphila rubida]
MKRVLVVEDDPPMLKALGIGLRAFDFSVVAAADAGTALDLAARSAPEAVLLDLGLPDLDGLDVLRSLRAWGSVPVVVVSGRSGIATRIEALDAGADDFVTKPFAIDELAARLRAVLRRPASLRPPEQVILGRYTVDLGAYAITRTDGTAGDEVHLTPTEWRLLSLLLRNPDRLVPGRELLSEVWGAQHVRNTNYLRVFMAGLRRKLEPDPGNPRHLVTEPGLGYRFQP